MGVTCGFMTMGFTVMGKVFNLNTCVQTVPVAVVLWTPSQTSKDKLLAMPTAWVAHLLAFFTYSTGLQLVKGAAPKLSSLS